MDQLIPIASKLQDVLGAVGQNTQLDLPQIVVVGGQSSGKSSVLEGIVGRSFLPRGHGIVTRRPLVLQLYNTRTAGFAGEEGIVSDFNTNTSSAGSGGGPSDYHDAYDNTTISSRSGRYSDAMPDSRRTNLDDISEWGEFLHLPGRKFYSFSQIRQEIVKETDRLTGINKGISNDPIHLKIYSPNVLALTMVDLPGMTKVPVGDQPDDIEEQIHQMTLEFISNPNAIILAVTAANTDIANSDALQLAKAADPYGNRTIGVLTKLDLMDPGTDASETLNNQLIPLRRGYIAVVNRGQKDINADLSIRDGLRKEEEFFRTHPVYSRDKNLLGKCGTKTLARTLNNILMHHIRDCLPEVKSRISSMMSDVHQELEALGSPEGQNSKSSLGTEMLNLLTKFATNFASIIDGKGGEINNSANTKNLALVELFGGARISFIFTEIFAQSLMSVGAFDGLSDEEIRTTIVNASGTRAALFVPEISFDILVRRQIARLEQPGIQCVDLVYEELQRVSTQAEPKELTRFPYLRDRIIEVISALLKRCMNPTQLMVSNLIKIELAYINTSHPDFIGGSRAVARMMNNIGSQNEARRARPIPDGVSRGEGGEVSATPMSTASAGNYYSGEGGEGDFLGNQHDGTGGIMNFIFRGGKSPIKAKPHPSGGPPTVVQLPPVPDTMQQTDVPPSDRERVEMEVIKSLIESYFAVVRKNFIDMVPKTIMFFLVNHVKDGIQNELVSELYRDSEIMSLMREAEDVAQRRQTCVEMKDLLTKALEIVNEVRDFNSFS